VIVLGKAELQAQVSGAKRSSAGQSSRTPQDVNRGLD
jgi:hypothetical protein